MNEVFQYLLKWSIALGVVFLFYRFALRPLTFYQWNRRYLILYPMAALLIPFVNLYTYVEPQQLKDVAFVQYIPSITIDTTKVAATTASNSISLVFIAGMVMLAGSVVLLARLVIQWLSLRRIRRRAVPLYHPDGYVYHINENVIPFSFGNAIYVNTTLHTEEELNDIILHEFVHVRQKHSFDIIWSEILCILNWYNPFAWCIRHAVRQNLEFIADQAVLQHGMDKKTYQYHLLKVIGSPQYSIANKFNFSSLKKRIAMMNRLKSARLHLVKFVFVLPLLAVMLVAFRNNKGWYQDITTDTIKKPAVETAELVEVRIMSLKEFYARNPSVKEVAWSNDDHIVIYLKNGQRESYSESNDADMKKFRATYGGLPTIISKMVAVPPHPPKPGEPATADKPEIAEVAIAGDAAVHSEQIALPPASPDVPVKVLVVPSPPTLPKGVTSIELEKNVLIVTLKNGQTERYMLTKPAEKAAAEKKYGKITTLVEIPVLVPKPPTADQPGAVEKPAKPAAEPVIRLQGSADRPASVRVIDTGSEQVMYADEIVIHQGVPKWSVVQNAATKPAFYLNGKRMPVQDPDGYIKPVEISHMEIIKDRVSLAAAGETECNAIINFVTKDNVHNRSAYVSKEAQKTIDEVRETSRIVNTLYMGRDNPIDINVQDVPEDEIEVMITGGGTIFKKNGRYYANPRFPGNVEIRIYKKESNSKKLLNKRVFRVVIPENDNKPVTKL